MEKEEFRKKFYRAEFKGVVSSIEVGDRGDMYLSLTDTMVVLNKVSFNESIDIQVNDSIAKSRKAG
uniref:hypothetical protein n=1 Tax=Roseivirga sp. TaxID=1964215 RepID=UPI004048A816